MLRREYLLDKSAMLFTVYQTIMKSNTCLCMFSGIMRKSPKPAYADYTPRAQCSRRELKEPLPRSLCSQRSGNLMPPASEMNINIHTSPSSPQINAFSPSSLPNLEALPRFPFNNESRKLWIILVTNHCPALFFIAASGVIIIGKVVAALDL